MVRPKVVFVRGFVGAGKTTYAKTKFPKYIYLDADTYFDKFKKMKFPHEFQNAHDWCRDEMLSNIDKGLNVVVANTFSTNRELQSYARLLDKKASYKVIRITSQYESTHNVPQDVIERIADRWEDIKGEVCDELPYDADLNQTDYDEGYTDEDEPVGELPKGEKKVEQVVPVVNNDVEALYRRLAELEVERARIMVQLIKS